MGPALTGYAQPPGGVEPVWVTTADLVTGTALSCPRPGGSPLQDALAAANAAARTASLRQLGAWFPGYHFDEAAQDMDCRQFSILELGDAVLRHLEHDEMMDRLLFDHDHRWGSDGMSFSHADAKGHRPPPEYVSRSEPKPGSGASTRVDWPGRWKNAGPPS